MNHFLRDKVEDPLRSRATIGQARPNGQPRPARRSRPGRHNRSAATARGEQEELCIEIHSNEDIIEARKRARQLAADLHFPSTDRTLIASAISELGRNIVRYAARGEIRLRRDEMLGATGIVITAADRGPGIRDLRAAMHEGMMLAPSFGLGLPGVKRVMDDFEIVSKPRQGTTVTVKKWKPQ